MKYPVIGTRSEKADTENTPGAFRDRVGLTLFWFCVLVFGYFVSEYPNWNTESHLYPAYTFVDHGTFKIDRLHAGLGDQSYWHGHYYSDKAPGLTFLAIPAYAVLHTLLGNAPAQGYLYYKPLKYWYMTWAMIRLRYAMTFFLIILPSAALVWLLWLFLTQLTGSAGWSLLLAGAYAFGTIAFVYSQWAFSHQLCAVLLFSSFLLLYWFVRKRPPDRRMYLITAAAGLLSGFSIISEYPTILIAFALGIYLLVIAQARVRTAVAYIAGMVPTAALAIYYNIAAFGAPFAAGYQHVSSPWYHSNVTGGAGGFANPLSYAVEWPSLNSLWQITLGTYRGIFYLCPVLLLFFVGLVYMWRRREFRVELFLFAAIVVVYFVVDSARGVDQNGWSGGASIASRHLAPMLPFMVVPIAFGLGNRLFRAVFLALSGISVAIMMMIVSQTSFFSQIDQNFLLHEVLPNFGAGRVGTNWAQIWWSGYGVTGLLSVVPLGIAVVLFVGRLWWLTRAWSRADASDNLENADTHILVPERLTPAG